MIMTAADGGQVLTRTFYIVLDLIHAQEEYAKLKGSVAADSRASGAAGAGAADAQKTIAGLQARLAAAEAKDRDFGARRVIVAR
jgi:hypothetical protein